MRKRMSYIYIYYVRVSHVHTRRNVVINSLNVVTEPLSCVNVTLVANVGAGACVGRTPRASSRDCGRPVGAKSVSTVGRWYAGATLSEPTGSTV